MTITRPTVHLGLFDPALLSTMAITANGAWAGCEPTSINGTTDEGMVVASLEPNFWLLDKSFHDGAGSKDGFISDTLSDGSGNFASPPNIIIFLSAASNSVNGLTLQFSPLTGDYATSIRIQFYDVNSNLLDDHTYAPTGSNFSTNQAVAGFKYFVITLSSTNIPYRRVRVSEIRVGNEVIFDFSAIKKLDIVEEIDRTSIETPINNGDLLVVSTAFDPLNPSGSFNLLQAGQPLDIYEQVGSAQLFMGRFYLKDWDNPAPTLMEFHFVDALGIADKYFFFPPLWKNGANFAFQLNSIQMPADIVAHVPTSFQYLIPLTQITTINGPTAGVSIRELLQNFAFPLSCYLTCARSRTIQIYDMVLAADRKPNYDLALTNADIGVQNKKLTLLPIVNGVEVAAHKYLADASLSNSTFYTATLDTGDYFVDIRLTGHMRTWFYASGCTLTGLDYDQMKLYFSVSGTGVSVSISTSVVYWDSILTTGAYEVGYVAGPQKNLIRIPSPFGFLANNYSTGMANLTTRLFGHYSERYSFHFKAYAPLFKVGQFLQIDLSSSQKLFGIVKRMASNLAGGFTSEVDVVGVLL